MKTRSTVKKQQTRLQSSEDIGRLSFGWHHLKETKGLRVNVELEGKFLLTERMLSFLWITLAELDHPTELDRQLINRTE